LFAACDVDTMWTAFMQVVNNANQLYIPKRSTSRFRKPLWMNNKTVRALRKKEEFGVNINADLTEQMFVRFKKVQNYANSQIRQSKRAFEQKVAENIKSDSKSFYAYARGKYTTKDRVGPLKDAKGDVILIMWK